MSDTTPATPAKRSYGSKKQKVPAFARYEGTSAYKKNRRRTREYARFKEAAAAASAA